MLYKADLLLTSSEDDLCQCKPLHALESLPEVVMKTLVH